MELASPVSPPLAGRFFTTETLYLGSAYHWLLAKTNFLKPPGGASGKESACNCRRANRGRSHSWVRKITWRRIWQPIPIFLTEIPSSVRGTPKNLHDWAHTYISDPRHRKVPVTGMCQICAWPVAWSSEFLCLGVTPKVTGELLILYISQDFPPSKPHSCSHEIKRLTPWKESYNQPR